MTIHMIVVEDDNDSVQFKKPSTLSAVKSESSSSGSVVAAAAARGCNTD